MLKTKEKTDTNKGRFESHPYNVKIIQQRFRLPTRNKDFKGNILFFVYESILLIYFCLRDKRFREIASVIFRLIKETRKNHLETQSHAPLLLNAFIELGSTFIKVGQFLSSRADLLPHEYIESLSQLQDSLPPIPFEEVKKEVEQELRNSIDNIFKSFESNPIASASIGQVHKATLLNGQEVVVKIQRKDLDKLFYQDLAILRCLASFFERHTKIGRDREWIEIIDEIGKTLFEEINFIQEGRNADKLRKNLKYEDRIYIPKIFWQYTTKKLITIEYVPGIKITDIDLLRENNFDLHELSLILVNAYFKQVFEDGFYHADPHPGNIVVRKDGFIVFYDFGMVGRISKNIRAELVNILASILANDTDALLRTLKKLELIKSDTDINPIKNVLEQAAYKYYEGAKLDSLDLNGIEDDLRKLFNEKPMKLPSKFTYTLRATGTLEGVCRTLNPDFSLVSAARPYLENWLKENIVEDKWIYLKAMFPNQRKLIDKAKIYFEVLKDLPKYINNIEQNNAKIIPETSPQEEKISLKEEVKETNTRLRLSYSIIILLCFVITGNYLIHAQYQFANITGVILLSTSFFGSVGTVIWALKRNATMN